MNKFKDKKGRKNNLIGVVLIYLYLLKGRMNFTLVMDKDHLIKNE